MRPELGLKDDIDEAIQHAAETGAPFRAWPQELKQLWRAEQLGRRRRELTFLHLLGLAWCMIRLALDYALASEAFTAALGLRLGLIAPVYALAIVAALYGGWHVQRWTTMATIPVFAGVAGYIGLHAMPAVGHEYVLTCGMLLTMAIVLIPLRLPSLAAMTALSLAGLWIIWATASDRGQDEMVLLTLVSAAACLCLLIPLRTARLKDKNFLFALRAQIVSRRLMEANEKLRALSDHDDMTGLPNRRYLERVFNEAFEGSLAAGTDLAVIMIDVDHFKAFNDTHGHVAGDRTLMQVARTLDRSISGPGRMVARYGGEEFIAILDGEDEESVLRIADNARLAVENRPISAGGRRRQSVTVSMGVALRRRVDRSTIAMIERADAALYEAKEAGRNLVRLAGRRDDNPPPTVLKKRA